ncbi:MAG: CehA/McbA family metallohydrolase, partial [Planctomycetaceae bacterium]|nr:CehA/McbA family metallohydrolase [Planctomycetaceae bacterium]
KFSTSLWTLLLLIGSTFFFGPLLYSEDPPPPKETFDAEIHQRLGQPESGFPATTKEEKSGTLQLKIVDSRTGKPLLCRVNLRGPDGNYYEPPESSLNPYSLHRLGNRKEKGPFRYYGWFFYSRGTESIPLPPGKTRIEVWKGFEYQPTSMTIDIQEGKTHEAEIRLSQKINMAQRGWFSGDPHIHIERKTDEQDELIFDLLEAEDIRYGQILCFGDTRKYSPTMTGQMTPQQRGLGPESIRTRGDYTMISGQEYRCETYGHILLLGARRMVDADGQTTDPNNWPLFGMVADETHALGGQAIHAHGGYEKEIYADFAQEATDGVELLQFAVYRGIGLEGWYHILNAGYRFPAIGASDYPFCRALGDCRTYAWIDQPSPSMQDWNGAVQAGHTFFTTGPVVEFSVNQKRPGEEVTLNSTGSEPNSVHVSIRGISLVSQLEELQLIHQGKIIQQKKLIGTERTGYFAWELDVPIEQSSWLAFRGWGKSVSGRENTEIHTNPVYVVVDGKPYASPESLRWLINKVTERYEKQAARDFPQKEQVLQYYEKSRTLLQERLAK